MGNDVSRQGQPGCVSSIQNVSEIKRAGKANGYDQEQNNSHGNKESSSAERASVHGGIIAYEGAAQGFPNLT
jgi:hypothetical protein